MEITYSGCGLTDEFAILANKYLTDKVSIHGYNRFYPKYLSHYKNVEGGAVMEIGVENGCSLNLWSDYFPLAYVYGADIKCETMAEFNEKRQKTFCVDQSKKEDLEKMCKNIEKPVFLILDDGSHYPEHQISTFEYLFSKLANGGTYIIEDIETSYWSKGNVYAYQTRFGYHHKDSTIEIFKLLLDDINTHFLTTQNKIEQYNTLKNMFSIKTMSEINTITFCKNCIIITKKTKEEIENDLNRGVYRFYDNL
jgi:hypothetical protein